MTAAAKASGETYIHVFDTIAKLHRLLKYAMCCSEWMRLNLIKFATDNPDLKVVTEKKRCVHPFVRGTYLNKNSKTICIKNIEPEAIQKYIFDLRNQIGRKVNIAMNFH